ncbi:hypothetical protein PG996_011945 [Apiospora saccharicola]|uniref:Uncharacterized protein n=1 Tax=Apiospora saccharicola TaxID=335842 RepID=A0ABR1U163_9PEZI
MPPTAAWPPTGIGQPIPRAFLGYVLLCSRPAGPSFLAVLECVKDAFDDDEELDEEARRE